MSGRKCRYYKDGIHRFSFNGRGVGTCSCGHVIRKV